MNLKLRLGWERDLPDIRDYDVNSTAIKAVVEKSNPFRVAITATVPAIDLRPYCSPVEDQGDIGSCTANAGVGLLEYFEKRTKLKFINASRLFLYKTTRNLLGWTGDQGAYLRSTMKAMVLFGVPPEESWPYDTAKFDVEPSSFTYAYAQNYKALQYYRLDPTSISGPQVLINVKQRLAAGLPSMFGFTVYSSINNSCDIPFPTAYDSVLGGHAVVAVGYHDSKMIGNRKGALLIRNSWGTGWGDKGYGWLPYDYVNYRLAVDFWSLVSASYIDTDLFK